MPTHSKKHANHTGGEETCTYIFKGIENYDFLGQPNSLDYSLIYLHDPALSFRSVHYLWVDNWR